MHFVRFFTCIASCFSVARAFSVTVGAPTQCDPLTISWTGGQEPFEILLTPNNEAYQNYSVPTSAFSNGKGSYSIPWLSLLAQTQFLLTMSDATGFGSGGTTDILTVGNQVGNTNCHAAVQPPPYTFSMNPNPSPPGYLVPQCSEINFTANSNAAPVVPPITIVQLIPGGQSVVINSMEASYTLDALDVNVGTTLMYFVTDSMGVQCGASRFYTVSGSSDSSCLIKPPTSTAGMSVTATATTTLPPSPLSSSSNRNVALIAGAAGGGGGAVLIALVILGMCLLRKRKASRSVDVQSSTKSHPRQLHHTDTEYNISHYGDIPPESAFPYKTNTINYHTRPTQASLRTQSDTTNSSAVNFAVGASPSSFNQLQHSRQSSNTDSPASRDARSSTMPSAYSRMATLFHPMTSNYPTQYPVGYPRPIRPGSQSPPLNASTGNPTVSERPTQFSQTLHPRHSSNDFDPYGDARSSAMSSADRRMATVAEMSSSLPSPWETDPVSYRGPPIQSGSQTGPVNMSPKNLVARDLTAPFNQIQPSSTDFAKFGVNVGARTSDMTSVEHMAVGPRPASLLPQKTDLVYLAPPIQPGSTSISTSASKITVNHHPTVFNQTQNFHQSPNTDAGSQSMASASAQTATSAVGQTTYQLFTQATMHTDAGDSMPGVNDLVEPPPQYSEHHGVPAM